MAATVNFNMDGTYTSFSGADAVATFNGRVIGELQAITVNIQREKGPIYVMGDADPISFSRGKRGIAGNLVFVVFDRDALLSEMEIAAVQNGTIPQYISAGSESLQLSMGNPGLATPVTQAGVYTGLPLNATSTLNELSTIVQFNTINSQAAALNAQGSFVQLQGDQPGEFWVYEDQVPPFDITITLANEYGSAAYMTIYQAEILNGGMGISIDDINIEKAATFVARKVSRVRPGFASSGQSSTSPIGFSSTAPGGHNSPNLNTA